MVAASAPSRSPSTSPAPTLRTCGTTRNGGGWAARDALVEDLRRGSIQRLHDVVAQHPAGEFGWPGKSSSNWGEWRPVDHARYVATLSKGGLVLRDGVLMRVDA